MEQGSDHYPNKHRKHETRLSNRQRLFADGLSTASPQGYITYSELERQLRNRRTRILIVFLVVVMTERDPVPGAHLLEVCV